VALKFIILQDTGHFYLLDIHVKYQKQELKWCIEEMLVLGFDDPIISVTICSRETHLWTLQ